MRTLCTCFSTVPSVTQSFCAMPAFERPSAIRCKQFTLACAQCVERILDPAGGDEFLNQRGSTTDAPLPMRSDSRAVTIAVIFRTPRVRLLRCQRRGISLTAGKGGCRRPR